MKIGKYERDFMNWKLIEENCFCGVRKWQPIQRTAFMIHSNQVSSLFNEHLIVWNITEKII